MSDAYKRPRRWLILLAYMPVVGLSQLLWLNFAPLIDRIEARYGVGEFTAGLLILVFPLIYVVLSTHAGLLVDRRGYRFAIGWGAVVMAVFSIVRVFDGTFAALLVGQIGIALAQPYVVNGISKLVGDWFTAAESQLAFGLGTMAMYIGMAIGLAVTPRMVEVLDLRATMGVFAAVSIFAAILFLAVVRPNEAIASVAEVPAQRIRPLLRNRSFVLLLTIAFLGLGEFNGLTTWLEQILKPRGVSAVEAGTVGATLIIGGIFGAAIIPALASQFPRRKPFILISASLATLTLCPMCETGPGTTLLALSALHGFFLLPSMALMLDMAAQFAGEQAAGAATGLLMLTGNAGGVVVAGALPLLRKSDDDFGPAVYVLVALLLGAVLLAAPLDEPRKAPALEPDPI